MENIFNPSSFEGAIFISIVGSILFTKLSNILLNKFTIICLVLVLLFHLYPNIEPERHSNIYILPQSSSAKLTWQDIRYLDSRELRLARNEIYARHGYKFKSSEIKNYFMNKDWYNESDNFKCSNLNSIEYYNINFIKSYEN